MLLNFRYGMDQCFLSSEHQGYTTRDLCDLACMSRGENATCKPTRKWAETDNIPGIYLSIRLLDIQISNITFFKIWLVYKMQDLKWKFFLAIFGGKIFLSVFFLCYFPFQVLTILIFDIYSNLIILILHCTIINAVKMCIDSQSHSEIPSNLLVYILRIVKI